MKKLIITAACVAAAVSGFAQGTVAFQNTVATTFNLGANSVAARVTTGTIQSQTLALGLQQTGANLSTGIIDVGLFWSTTSFSSISGGTLAGIENMNSTANGQLNGNGSFAITGAGAATGDTVFLQVFAWDNSYGDSAAGAAAALAAGAWFGSASAGVANTTYGTLGTSISTVLGSPSPAPGTAIFSTAAGFFGKTVLLAQTPEPATLALGGMGAAALLLFRRRK
jgi:hypothetical protein